MKYFLNNLQYLSKKYELVLLSNYFEKSQRNRLEAMGINKYFKKYYGENKIKPYAESYLQAKGIFKQDKRTISHAFILTKILNYLIKDYFYVMMNMSRKFA